MSPLIVLDDYTNETFDMGLNFIIQRVDIFEEKVFNNELSVGHEQAASSSKGSSILVTK